MKSKAGTDDVLSDSLNVSFVKQAAAELHQGNIILYPTDTVYGLGVDALSSEAVIALQNLKGKREDKHFLIIVPSIETISEYAVTNDIALDFAKKFLPGPFTLVLPAKDSLPKELVHDDGTIGIRIPNNQFCLDLAKAFDRPFITTSANISGSETGASVEEILRQFGDRAKKIALVIDEGERPAGKPSTIVRFTSDVPEVIREGVLSREILGL